MKKRVFTFLFSLCFVAALLPVTASAEVLHSHTVCYGASCPEALHASHDVITWEPWTSKQLLPDSEGSYYLTSDVTLAETAVISADINLDLNGHTVKLEEGKTGSVIKIESGTLNLTDCQGFGKVTGGVAADGGGIYVASGAALNLYGGSVTGSRTTNVYSGGDIYKKGTYSASGGTFKAYGGTYGGVWGGVDWALTVLNANGTGKLTISRTNQDPDTLEIMPRQPSGKTGVRFAPGYWREGIHYSPDAYYQPWGVENVTELEILPGVTGIGTFSAMNMPCTGELYIPKTVNYIGWEAFNGADFYTLTFEARDESCEPLCIAQGAFKQLNITSVELPEGLKCIHCWVFCGCPNLKHVTIPASVERMSGEDHRYDYGASNNANTSSAIFAGNPTLESITFKSEESRNKFLTNAVIGGSSNNKTTPTFAAFTGLTGYAKLQDALDAAEPGETVKLMNSTTVAASSAVIIPEGVTLDLNGKTLTNNGTVTNLGQISGTGTFNNNGQVGAVENSVSDSLTWNGAAAYTVYAVIYKIDGEVVKEEGVKPGEDAVAPELPAKVGYDQVAPYWDKDGKNITAGTEINAVYTINKYTVTYKADGKVVKTATVEYGKDAAAPAIPAKTGYDKAVWDKDGKNITADTEINVVYTINKYTVTYKIDGVIVKSETVEHGKDATAPKIPAKAGYDETAPAWDKDSKNITADTVITAVYTKNEPGEYKDVTAAADNVNDGKIVNTVEELKDAIPMDADEKAEQEKGADIQVWLEVKDISKTVSADEKSLVEKKLDGGAAELYLDVTMFKKVGSDEITKLSELNEKVTLSITVPDELINKNKDVIRTYYVVRIHDGAAQVITPAFDPETKTLTFETDCFSTYAITYKDAKVANPVTGDNNSLVLWSMLLLVSGGTAVVLSAYDRKRRAAGKN